MYLQIPTNKLVLLVHFCSVSFFLLSVVNKGIGFALQTARPWRGLDVYVK